MDNKTETEDIAMLVIVCVQMHYYTLQVMHKSDYICICFQKGFQCSIIDAVRYI